MQIKFISPSSDKPPSLLRKTGMIVGAVTLGGLALMFSAMLLPFILVGVAYLWWRTRKVREQFRQMREQMQQMQGFPPPHDAAPQSEAFRGNVYEGEIIEGESVRIEEKRR
ncbi:MAG: hypothetical protein HY849_05505 [Nitrosomonadales bacterium]|nr:hypothetical protein [Nitrosomonadales bacterium]